MHLDHHAIIRPWLIPLSVYLIICLLAGGAWWYLKRQQADTLAQYVPADAAAYLHFSFPHQLQGVGNTSIVSVANTVLDALNQTLFADLPGIVTDQYGQPAFDRELAVGVTTNHQWFALVRLTTQQVQQEQHRNANRFVAPRVLFVGDMAVLSQLNTTANPTPSLSPRHAFITIPGPFVTGHITPNVVTAPHPVAALLAKLPATPHRIRLDLSGHTWIDAESMGGIALASLLTTAVPSNTTLTLAHNSPATALQSVPHGQFSTWEAIARTIPPVVTYGAFWQRPAQVILTPSPHSLPNWTVVLPRENNETIDTLRTVVAPLLATRFPIIRLHTLPDGSTSQELITSLDRISDGSITASVRSLTAPGGDPWYIGVTDSFFIFGNDQSAILALADQTMPTLRCANQNTPKVVIELSSFVPFATQPLFFVGSGDSRVLSGCIISPQ